MISGCPWPRSFGTGPVSLLKPTKRYIRRCSREMVFGNSPSSWLFQSSRRANAAMPPIHGGIVPLRLFPAALSQYKFESLQISTGIGPWSGLFCRSSTSNSPSVPSSQGITPVKLLFESSRYCSCRSVAIVGGIGPENQFDLTLRYVRFGAIFGINSRIGPESLFHDTSRNVRLGHSRMNWGKLPLTD